MQRIYPVFIFLLCFCLVPTAYSADFLGFDDRDNHPELSTKKGHLFRAVRNYDVTFEQINNVANIPLRGSNTDASLYFGVPRDKLVTYAKVKFIYNYSPSLIAHLSHVKIYLNQEVVGILPLDKNVSGHSVSKELTLDPLLFSDQNELKMQFVGHYQTNEKCEDPIHSSLWVDISRKSSIEFNVEHLAMVNDLALFPEPFFDKRSRAKLTLPFIFAEHPSNTLIESAGIISSWFGAKSQWRGARFPVLFNSRPKSHAIVLATNSNKPEYLSHLTDVEKPTITMISLPQLNNEGEMVVNQFIKLLVVLGKDDADVKIAAQALTLGQAVLTGDTVEVLGVDLGTASKAYDAPNWVRLDRPTKFIELVEAARELEAVGYTPAPIKLAMRIPADLFLWRSKGVPVDIKYRYSSLKIEGESRLNINVNGQFVEAFNLHSTGKEGVNKMFNLPLLTGGLFESGNKYFLPAFKLGSDNQMEFDFNFSRQAENPCVTIPIDNMRASIDGDSTLNFSGFPHYTELPNLAFFANSGYPFTVHADLAKTVVLMSKNTDKYEIETFLTLLGRMGNSTGAPATRVQVKLSDYFSSLTDKNIMILGLEAHKSFVDHFDTKLPVELDANGTTMSLPERNANFLVDWFGFDTDPNTTPTSEININGNGVLSTLVGFESPVSTGRSVVSIIGSDSKGLAMVLDTMEDREKISHIHGSVAQIRPTSVASYLVGDTYTIGELPTSVQIWYFLSKHPLFLTLITIFSVFVLAVLLWRTLRFVMSRRLNYESDK